MRNLESNKPAPDTRPSAIRVLLVEDNQDDAILVREELQELHDLSFEVHHELELGRGIQKLSESPFDCVLLDLSLPDSHGLSTIRNVRERFPEVPIVVLSGHDEATFAAPSLLEGAQDYVVKGYGDAFGVGRSLVYAVRRKSAEHRRKMVQNRMGQAHKLESLAVLAGGIAHDFNNVLTAILGHTDVLLNTLPPEDAARSSAQAIESAAMKASEMTAQLLAYAGRGILSFRSQDLNEVLRDISAVVVPMLPRTTKLEVSPGESLPEVEIDKTQIEQLIMNLILNGSDALEGKEGTITVESGLADVTEDELASCHRDRRVSPGKFVFFEVRDSGEGMDAEARARMFDPFFTTKADGRGLGLATTIGSVTRHRGAILVNSQLGEGTSVRVLLPPAASAREPVESGASESAKRTVLVVQEGESLQPELRSALESAGFTAMSSSDSAAALALFDQQEESVDAVVLEWTGSRARETELLTRIRDRAPEVPVVLLSDALEGHGDAASGQGLYVIKKPVDPGLLVTRLQYAMTRLTVAP